MSAVAVGQGGATFAQQAAPGQMTEGTPGLTERQVAEIPSVVPGFAKVRPLEVTWQPGAKGPTSTMKDPVICEMSRGELDEVENGRPVRRRAGATCGPARSVTSTTAPSRRPCGSSC